MEESKTSVSKSDKFVIGNYRLEHTIGTGTFGKVKLGVNKITGEKVAVKLLERERISDKEEQERILREMKYLKSLNHPNIIKVYEILETEKCFCIVMEYASGGELFQYIVRKKRLIENEVNLFFYQMVNGLDYIHKNNVAHRDLKPENLLLKDEKGRLLKIIDFGLSNDVMEGKQLVTPCGSPCYAAPEMVMGKKYSGVKVDIWSAGVTLYAMTCGYLPFEDKTNENLYRKIIECKVDYPHFIPFIHKDLIKRILVPNPKERITLEEIKRHPVYSSGKVVFMRENKKLYDEFFNNGEGDIKESNFGLSKRPFGRYLKTAKIEGIYLCDNYNHKRGKSVTNTSNTITPSNKRNANTSEIKNKTLYTDTQEVKSNRIRRISTFGVSTAQVSTTTANTLKSPERTIKTENSILNSSKITYRTENFNSTSLNSTAIQSKNNKHFSPNKNSSPSKTNENHLFQKRIKKKNPTNINYNADGAKNPNINNTNNSINKAPKENYLNNYNLASPVVNKFSTTIKNIKGGEIVSQSNTQRKQNNITTPKTKVNKSINISSDLLSLFQTHSLAQKNSISLKKDKLGPKNDSRRGSRASSIADSSPIKKSNFCKANTLSINLISQNDKKPIFTSIKSSISGVNKSMHSKVSLSKQNTIKSPETPKKNEYNSYTNYSSTTTSTRSCKRSVTLYTENNYSKNSVPLMSSPEIPKKRESKISKIKPITGKK